MKKRVLILGESNSVYREGWVAGFSEATKNEFEIVNRSVGSTGIFNAIQQLCQLDQDIEHFDAIIFDSCIQDATFFKHRLSAYRKIVEQMFDYLSPLPIFTSVVQFEALTKTPHESEFYEQFQSFYQNRINSFFRVTELIKKNDAPEGGSELATAYADNHHINTKLARRIGVQIGTSFLKGFTTKNKTKTSEPIANFFDFLDATYLGRSIGAPISVVRNSLVDFKSIVVGLSPQLVPISESHQHCEIIGIMFNATNSNGTLQISSDSQTSKILSNHMRETWDKALVWARCLHQPVKLSQSLTLQTCVATTNMEQTEYCDQSAFTSSLPTSVEILGLIIMRTRSTDIPNKLEIDKDFKTRLANLFNAGQFEEVIANAREALSKASDKTFIWKILSASFIQTGRHQEAIATLDEALKTSAKDAEIHNMLAANLQAIGRLTEAENFFLSAIALKPNYVEANFNLGDLYFCQRRYAEAQQYYSQTLTLRADFTLAKPKLAMSLFYLGELDKAETIFNDMLVVDPSSFETHCNLGKVLLSQSEIARAEYHFRTSIELNPNFIEGISNLSNLLAESGRYTEAEQASIRALQLSPRHIGALSNLALAQRGLGRLNDAENTLVHALQIDAEDAEIKANLSLILLSQGKYEEGWKLHESRFHEKNVKGFGQKPSLDSVQWTNQDIKNKTLLILPEQGLGDQIQFIRYVKLLETYQPRQIYFQCTPALFSIFRNLENTIFKLLPTSAPLPKHDYWTFLLSLPNVLGTTLDSIPQVNNYLAGQADLVQKFRTQFRENPSLKIGICWSGSKRYKHDAERSIGLAPFERLRSILGIQFFCLQSGERQAFIASFSKQGFDLGHEVDEFSAPFEETAALIENMDLIITCDTVIGHLAGALGKQVWLLLPFVADWRWMTQRDDTPWYPETRLFRQNESRSWNILMERIAIEITKFQSRTMKNREPKTRFEIPCSVGDFIDRLSILEIKQEKINDEAKLFNVCAELKALQVSMPSFYLQTPGLDQIYKDLKAINLQIWEVEEGVRYCESIKTFDHNFVTLARSVYTLNDQRAALKKKLNILMASDFIEEKSHATGSKENHSSQLFSTGSNKFRA